MQQKGKFLRRGGKPQTQYGRLARQDGKIDAVAIGRRLGVGQGDAGADIVVNFEITAGHLDVGFAVA